MKIWLCKHSEPIPVDLNSRLYRVGMIADSLRKKKHEVFWWTSDYNHVKKNRYTNIDILPNGTALIFGRGIEYKKNISFSRIINHTQIGSQFTRRMNKVEYPDVIYTTIPTLDYAYRAVKFGKKNSIPVVVDILDLWPDVFLDLIPLDFLKKDWMFYLSNKKLEFILTNADYIIGITEEYLMWGLDKINARFDKDKHKVFPIGYKREKTNITSEKKGNKFKIIFAGTIGYHFDLNTVFEAAALLEEDNIEFNILGDGDLLEQYREKYLKYSNINFLGWTEGDITTSHLMASDIGIAPYNNSKNFILNIPNKPYEYIAYNLPVLTCLKGATKKFLETHDIGYFYEEKNSENLAEKIIEIKNNKDLLNLKRKNCEITFKNNYNASTIYDELAEFLEKVSMEDKSTKMKKENLI
ncbi:glycosyltransferase family 4 protein [Planococcus sp. YIM B11945]|uniref:glycosyltransferase family 4 protein n=1 Tax=Planococcus sp. YIM B11945 TaxID=3435410 RepID=UPI003D7C527E